MTTFLESHFGKERVFFLIASLLYLVFILPFTSFYPLWDGYYFFSILREAISNTANISEFFGLFNLNSHPSMGYAAYASLGQYISFNNQYVLHCQNIALNLIASYCFYYIIIYFVGRNNSIEALLISAIFLFHPLNNATLLNFNLDYPTLIFFTSLIYAQLYKKYFVILLSGGFLVFSKESGIILYLSFLASLFFIPSVQIWISTSQLRLKRIKYHHILPLYFLIFYFCTRHFFKQSLLFSAGYSSSSDIIKELFSINLHVIWARVLQVFILDFNWLPSLLLAYYFIKLLISRRISRFENPEKHTNFLLIVFIFTLYLYTSLFVFKMVVHPRYMVVSIFFLLLFFAIALVECIPNKKTRSAIACVLLFSTIAQNYRSFDPVSNDLFGTYDFGTHRIVKTDALIQEAYGTSL
jgi:hypothetical protein